MPALQLSRGTQRLQRLAAATGHLFLLAVTSLSALAVFAIFFFIAKDAIPFFQLEGFQEFFTSTRWYPSADEAGVRRAGDLRRQRAGDAGGGAGGGAAGHRGGGLPERRAAVFGAPDGQAGDRDAGGDSLGGLRFLRPGRAGAAAAANGGPVLAAAAWIIGAPLAGCWRSSWAIWRPTASRNGCRSRPRLGTGCWFSAAIAAGGLLAGRRRAARPASFPAAPTR